jgi:hypothetical protein
MIVAALLTVDQIRSLIGSMVGGLCMTADSQLVRDTMRTMVELDEYWRCLPKMRRLGEASAMQVMNEIMTEPATRKDGGKIQ